jgi:hypothetical protein
MSKSVDEQIRKAARRNVGDGPEGHKAACMCGECVKHKARIEDEADRIAESVLAGVREDNQADAEHEQFMAGRQALGESREVAAGAVVVRRKLAASIEGHLRRAAAIVDEAGDGRMSDEAYKAFSRASTRAAELAETDRALEGLEGRAVQVVSESRVYGPHSRASWFEDLLLRSDFDPVVRGEARERQARYSSEMAYEVRRGSEEGRRVVRAIREKTRCEREDLHREQEARAVGTDGGVSATAGGEMAAVVSPYFIFAEYALFKGIARSFADQCHSYPLPPYGLKIYVPRFTSAASASEQVEGSAVSESSPTAGLEGATVETVSGQVVISKQLSDRGLGGGGAFDLVIGKQVHTQLDQEIDKLALNAAITNGEAVTGQSAYTTKNLYQDVAKGREKLSDTSGVRLRPTHFFSSSDIYSYATRQVDGSERPILTPEFAPGFPIATGSDGGQQDTLPPWSRFTGTMLPGSLPWFTNDNLATMTIGTTSQVYLIVSAPDEAIDLLEGEPILTSFAESDAAHAQVRVNLRSYVAAVTKHSGGTAAISSAAYVSSLV